MLWAGGYEIQDAREEKEDWLDLFEHAFDDNEETDHSRPHRRRTAKVCLIQDDFRLRQQSQLDAHALPAGRRRLRHDSLAAGVVQIVHW